ncbi:hypothetical protein FH966_08785 [Lentibacillus cibarius]|uniref:DoxX family protein n=1 Tax=Lentibacillus cibarius TaxID=2583219 RepID=A0A549YIQ6_9BACI|nr:DoxX family protein [Lentibacillus cibarius]TMN22962.1 hypothetical protein FFL34_13375 [Lentibacillus cibarius]TRM11765.1 hypothetical protein FH966_08785 [Lentibacillus cibarius]
MLQHFSNGYVAKTLFQSSLPKVQNDDQAAAQFKEGFNLSRNAMKFTGLLELIGSVFLFISIISKSGKKFARIGVLLTNIVLGGAIFKHLQAGHGVDGSKKALKLFGLNILNFIETMRK